MRDAMRRQPCRMKKSRCPEPPALLLRVAFRRLRFRHRGSRRGDITNTGDRTHDQDATAFVLRNLRNLTYRTRALRKMCRVRRRFLTEPLVDSIVDIGF